MNRQLSASLLCALVALLGAGYLNAAEPTFETITDKTLVGWVRLANTKQRAGAVVTLIDNAERFDSIVFGENAPGKWMAGSDFFRRTEKDQKAYPSEPAGGKAFVQVAISYRGNEVTIYRNAKQQARYKIKAPQPFKPGCKVLIGLRFTGAQGLVGFLSGAIDDVRIYDRALSGEQLSELKPNSGAGHKTLAKPIAWWTFEDGSPNYAGKIFGPAKLKGNARIADGKLILDGRDSYLIATKPPPFKPEIQSMFYKARHPETGNMWDTWLYMHDGTYYLYYLANKSRRWDNISMATSTDGVHWKEIGQVLYKGPGVTWMGTGSTWKSPNFKTDGKFFMNFSEWKGPRQTIFFAESKDLIHWKRLRDADLEFRQDERWYKPKGRWDCIWTIARPGGGLYGYWTATPKPETHARFGFGETLDGVHWKALAPPKVHGVTGGEVGAVEKIGDKYHMMFGNHMRMVTLVADKPQGPFNAAKKNLSFLSGHTYFSRLLRTPDGVLANHHSIARNRQVSMAPLKSVIIDKEGTMRLGWWKGNERMKHSAISVKMPANVKAGPTAPTMLETVFDAKIGVILEGTIRLPDAESSPRRGLYVEYGQKKGSAILIDSAGRAQLGPLNADGSGFKAEKKVDREMTFAAPAKFRLLLKGSLLEFYLDDMLIECFSLPGQATGRVGLIGPNKSETFANLRAWR